MSDVLRGLSYQAFEDPPSPAGGRDPLPGRGKPVGYRDLFSVREFRAFYFASLANGVGDYLARAAITLLVYQQTGSVLLSAAAFAVGFLPWVVGGPWLTAMAERYPHRRILIVSDLSRMVLIGLLLIPHLPVAVMLILFLVAAMGAPPALTARSELLPRLVEPSQVPVARSLNLGLSQAVQVVGYLAGSLVAVAVSPRLPLLVDVLTFAFSALLISSGISSRPAAPRPSRSFRPLREMSEGIRLVFGRSTLRCVAIAVFVMTMVAIVPEGLAAAWAAQADPDGVMRGLDQGLIMAAGPVGFVIGSTLISRTVSAALRDLLIRPLAVLSALLLVPTLVGPPLPVVAALVGLSGMAQGGLFPVLNGKFVMLLPHGLRARAYAVMQTGMQLSQFAAVMLAGSLAGAFRLPLVVGLWGLGGALLIAPLAIWWPSRAEFGAAEEEAFYSQAEASMVTAPSAEDELRILETENRDAEEAAQRCAHPLLAEDFRAAAARLHDVLAARGPTLERWEHRAQQLLTIERSTLDHNRRRLRSARRAYRFNLPLSREAAANFAAARMAERIGRVEEALRSYLPDPQGGSHV